MKKKNTKNKNKKNKKNKTHTHNDLWLEKNNPIKQINLFKFDQEHNILPNYKKTRKKNYICSSLIGMFNNETCKT